MDSRAQHVRAGTRRVAGRELEGLVGREPAVSLPGLRADAPSARAHRDGGRYHVSLRHRGHPRGARACARSGGRPRRAGRRRCRDDPGISAGGPHRRDASCGLARSARQRRTSAGRARPARARLPRQRARSDAKGYAHRPHQAGVSSMSLTLYFHPLSSFCHKVLIALYENDTPFTPQLVNLQDEEERAAFRKMWPIGKFPLLRDEARDWTVNESSIIIEYLDQHFPGRTRFIPDDPELARQMRFRDRFFDLYIHMQMQKIVSDRLRPADKKDPHGVEEARTT